MDDLATDRHYAIRVLSAAVAEERLPIEQLEARLALVRQAPNRATLDAILADLEPAETIESVPASVPHPDPDEQPGPVTPAEVIRIAAILSSSKRAGSWTVPYRLEVKVLLGDLTIDLREAVFLSDMVEVELDVLLGSLVLIVPAGTQVENECEERWSSTTHSTRSARGTPPIGVLVRIAGRVRWSSIEIKEKRRPGEGPSVLRKLLGD